MSNSVTKFGMNSISPNAASAGATIFVKTLNIAGLWCVTATEYKTREWELWPQKRENGI